MATTAGPRPGPGYLYHKQADCEGTLSCPGCSDCDPDYKKPNATSDLAEIQDLLLTIATNLENVNEHLLALRVCASRYGRS